jgi:hypothetical protein
MNDVLFDCKNSLQTQKLTQASGFIQKLQVFVKRKFTINSKTV